MRRPISVTVRCLGTLLAVLLAPHPALAAAADDALAAAVDFLHANELGLWVGLTNDEDAPSGTTEQAHAALIQLRFREVTRLPSLAASNLLPGTFTLAIGTDTFTTWGPFEARLNAADRVIRLEGDRMMRPAGAPSPVELTKPTLDGRIALELKITNTNLLVVRRATWTRAGGEVVNLLDAVPGEYRSLLGVRLGWVAID